MSYISHSSIAYPKSTPSVLPLDLQSHCIGYWIPNGPGGKLYDFTKYQNHATRSGAVAKAENHGWIEYVDATNDYFNAGASTLFDDIPNLSFEVFWKYLGVGGFSEGRLFDKTQSLTLGKFITVDSIRHRHVVYSFFTLTNGIWITENNTIVLNKWYHSIFSYNHTSVPNNVNIYVNGMNLTVTRESVPTGNYVSDVGKALYFGNRSSTNIGLNGNIGLIRMYNKLLTQADAKRLYKLDAWRFNLK